MKSAEQLEIIFLELGRIRLGKEEFANDSGYWTGGRCNWGANHNLKEDCQTLVKGFGKIESLEKMSNELQKCTTKQEFDNKKAEYLRKCNEINNGLTPNYGAHSSVFGICIIWSDSNMKGEIEEVAQETKREVERVRNSLSAESYQWIEELNRINLEINQLEQKMEDNKRKAQNETDPIARARIIALIEEDGKVLQTKLAKRNQMENRLNFDTGKYVYNMIEAMKKAIEGSNSSGGNGNEGSDRGGNRNPYYRRTPRNPNNPNPRGSDVNLPGPDEIPDPNPTAPNQNNQ